MKRERYYAPKDFRFVEVTVPNISPNEVLIKE